MNDSKTEQKCYVEGLNCSKENARDNMMAVKKRFRKVDGILAFHGYQSFAPGEVTPQLAHDIGIELATRMWGDIFQVIVATHLDKEHIHNHFVINSVSFVDGKKYNSCKESYRLLRKTSDDICREYGLSVIEKPKSSERVPYHIHEAEENNQLTKNNFMKNDIDECILLSVSEQDFFSHMQRRGYSFDFNHKYPTISHPNFAKARRLYKLGDDYTPENILKRIQQSPRRQKINFPIQDNLVDKYFVPMKDPTYQEVYVRFVTVVKTVKKHPNSNRYLYSTLYAEVKKLDQLIEQQNLLCGNNIDTPEQLADFKQSRKEEIKELEEARNVLRNKLKIAVRSGDEKEIRELKEHISNLSARISILRRDVIVCERIDNQKPVIDERIDECKKLNIRKERNHDEQFRRSR